MSGNHAPVPDRSWNWPGRRRIGEPIGEGVEQQRAGVIGVDPIGVEPDAETAGEVGGAVAETLDSAPVGWS